MTIQYSTAVRNAKLDTVESTTGTAAVLRILTGTPPANCATAETGTILAQCTLPTDWMAAASGGTKGLLGTWQDTSANATGTATYFRIYDSTITTCHVQGTYGTSGTDMIGDSASFTAGQAFSITSFTLTAGNA